MSPVHPPFVALRPLLAAVLFITALAVHLDATGGPPSATGSLYALPGLLLLSDRRPWLSLAVALVSGGCGFAVGVFAHGDGWWAGVTAGVAMAAAIVGVLAVRQARTHAPPIPPLVTVCAWTKRVKVGDGWVSFDRFLTDHLGLRVTHGICEEAAWQMLAEVRRDASSLEDVNAPPT